MSRCSTLADFSCSYTHLCAPSCASACTADYVCLLLVQTGGRKGWWWGLSRRGWGGGEVSGGGRGADLDHDRQEGEVHSLKHRVALDLVAQRQQCSHVQLITQVEVGDGARGNHAVHHGPLVAPQRHNGGSRMQRLLLCCLLGQQASNHRASKGATMDMGLRDYGLRPWTLNQESSRRSCLDRRLSVQEDMQPDSRGGRQR